jgi:hypothetical protein
LVRPHSSRGWRELLETHSISRSAGYVDEALPISKVILSQLGSQTGEFEVDTIEVISNFSRQPQALRRNYILHRWRASDERRSKIRASRIRPPGRRAFCIHSVSDTFYTWPDTSISLVATLTAISCISWQEFKFLIIAVLWSRAGPLLYRAGFLCLIELTALCDHCWSIARAFLRLIIPASRSGRFSFIFRRFARSNFW